VLGFDQKSGLAKSVIGVHAVARVQLQPCVWPFACLPDVPMLTVNSGMTLMTPYNTEGAPRSSRVGTRCPSSWHWSARH
jgi:hypothetical protein